MKVGGRYYVGHEHEDKNVFLLRMRILLDQTAVFVALNSVDF